MCDSLVHLYLNLSSLFVLAEPHFVLAHLLKFSEFHAFMTNLRALVGMHKPAPSMATAEFLEDCGYDVMAVHDVEEMLDWINNSESKPPYNLIVMDVNLGMPGHETVEPALRVGKAMNPWVDQYKFYTVSGNADAVKLAREHGLPCYLGADLSFKLEEDLM